MLFGALCGLEYIAILAGESRDPARSIGQSVLWSSPVICAMFILGTASVVALVPRSHIDFIAPIPQAMRLTLGNRGLGSLAAMLAILLLQVRLISAASYIFTGVTRLPMAAGWNHMVPAWFTRLHPRRRTPTNSILATAALVVALVIGGSAGVHAQEAFQLLEEREPHPLRGRLPGDVRAASGRSGKLPPRPLPGLAALDFGRRLCRDPLQPRHLRLPVCGCCKRPRLRLEDRRHGLF